MPSRATPTSRRQRANRHIPGRTAAIRIPGAVSPGMGPGRVLHRSSSPPLPRRQPAATPPPPDPGTSAKIYTNGNSVVTQATRLQSTDGRALLAIGEGIVAKDAGGNSLAEVTLKALPEEDLPAVPSGSVFSFDGMVYEIGPDGADLLLPGHPRVHPATGTVGAGLYHKILRSGVRDLAGPAHELRCGHGDRDGTVLPPLHLCPVHPAACCTPHAGGNPPAGSVSPAGESPATNNGREHIHQYDDLGDRSGYE